MAETGFQHREGRGDALGRVSPSAAVHPGAELAGRHCSHRGDDDADPDVIGIRAEAVSDMLEERLVVGEALTVRARSQSRCRFKDAAALKHALAVAGLDM